jgi:hypothetical protein
MDQAPEAQASGTKTAAPSASKDLASRERVALTQGRGGILGVKAGMTQVYNEAGDAIAVTVIDLKPTIITQVKTKDKNGKWVTLKLLRLPAFITFKNSVFQILIRWML